MKKVSYKKLIFGIVAVAVIVIAVVLVLPKKDVEPIESVQSGDKDLVVEDHNNQTAEVEMVWYEVPELGVRFKVTPDAKEDLRYKFSEHQTLNNDGQVDENSSTIASVVFYSDMETDDQFTGCTLSESEGFGCGRFQLSRKTNESEIEYVYSGCIADGGKKMLVQDNGYFCYRI